MIDTSLAKIFEEKAQPTPVLAAAAYGALLEKLLAEGRGYGKTEPVAAYLLRDMRIVTEKDDGTEAAAAVPVKPLYIVMDITEWPNEYGRSLVLQDIAVSWARRLADEGDLNGPDFKGPGLWTTKQSALEFDYKRREGADDNGRPLHVYDPNPEAYRLTLRASEPVTIPTHWGEPWHIAEGGVLALRERDVPALSEALQSIRDGKATPEEALLEKKADGKTYARFDVYGMMPGFLEDNYKPVFLKESTRNIAAAFAAGKKQSKNSKSPQKPLNVVEMRKPK